MYAERNFESDLAFGQALEVEFKTILEEEGWTVEQSNGYVPEYDLKATKGEEQATFECKTDTEAINTGNIPIEISKTLKGVTTESGITTSKADYHVFKLEHFPYFYLISTDKIRQLIAEGYFKFQAQGGDGDRTGLCLIDKDLIISQSQKIKRKETPEIEAANSAIIRIRELLHKGKF